MRCIKALVILFVILSSAHTRASDYFENARKATQVLRENCLQNAIDAVLVTDLDYVFTVEESHHLCKMRGAGICEGEQIDFPRFLKYLRKSEPHERARAGGLTQLLDTDAGRAFVSHPTPENIQVFTDFLLEHGNSYGEFLALHSMKKKLSHNPALLAELENKIDFLLQRDAYYWIPESWRKSVQGLSFFKDGRIRGLVFTSLQEMRMFIEENPRDSLNVFGIDHLELGDYRAPVHVGFSSVLRRYRNAVKIPPHQHPEIPSPPTTASGMVSAPAPSLGSKPFSVASVRITVGFYPEELREVFSKTGANKIEVEIFPRGTSEVFVIENKKMEEWINKYMKGDQAGFNQALHSLSPTEKVADAPIDRVTWGLSSIGR